ncbi:hypothetical protein GQ607_005668 [Colletotrichum asianum]|uniref:Uncharacterized protein n=1 Tax=Colletotrichum asianum TaxID=702518 RepID=A0A8H3WIP6_9PEZI|nr:hypothetical protein GQ607_005668 [Colletotrichum asianum]
MNDGPVRQWRAGLVCDLNDLCIEPVTKIKGGWADCQPVLDLGFSPKVSPMPLHDFPREQLSNFNGFHREANGVHKASSSMMSGGSKSPAVRR